MTAPAVDPTLLALAQQLVCYRKLAKLAEVQHGYVQHSQTEQLLDLLKRREEVLAQVSAFERAIAPAKKRWGAYLSELDETRRRQAEGLLAETRRLLEEITTADRNDALVLQQRKLNIGRQLNSAQVARTVNKNYAAAAAYAPRRSNVDRTS